MKTNKAVKMGSNLVGVEINTIQDVVKAQAAGLELVNKDGWGYNYTTDDEETGEEVEPTEKEIFDRITKDIAEGKEVYACMILADDWRVQRNAKTNLLCDFYLHQHVYTMHENKIVEGEIVYLSLAQGSLGDNAANALYGDMAEQLYYNIGYYFTNGRTPKIGFQREQIIKKINSLKMHAHVVLKTKKCGYLTRDLEEIFATTDELVANLMQD
ncbi:MULTISPECIES: hypothetical protein [Prevotellaceae]|uniref:hypothetical protein n=1 Tax=Prevotellaceae TaxID=171552 RepID=UPI000E506BE2|nr:MULTISPECIES: hypothetical protein [Prevotellaceae]